MNRATTNGRFKSHSFVLDRPCEIIVTYLWYEKIRSQTKKIICCEYIVLYFTGQARTVIFSSPSPLSSPPPEADTAPGERKQKGKKVIEHFPYFREFTT
jgi:hypothetical protein